ncbi:MAG: hypothetical protein KC684_10510, partial [Candidatus Omnitrophica bacterium]|nr:hypothetical protein [Candidatus Omnitrophota bacterium]
GAGKIGEYTMCSFRIMGVGTYKPGSKSNPHLGKQKKLSQNNETRLEVECDESVLNDVLDNMLETHPYEEVAYEIYDFRKRENRSDGSIITFKKKIEYSDLVKRFNKNISEPIHKNKYLKRLAIVNDSESDIHIERCTRKEADAVLFVNNKVNLIIL